MPALPDLNTSSISRSVLPIWLNSSSFTGSEKREGHVPHMVFFEDTLFTHASFVHQCVFTTLLPAQDRTTRQPGKHTLTLRETVASRTTRVPRLYTQSIPVHICAHPFDTWVTGPVVYATRPDKREDVGQLEFAIQPNAAARPRGGPWSR